MSNHGETNEWSLYRKSVDYKNRIGLYENVDRNEAFYAGDQWRGVVANGLPQPIFNIFKRVINYFISAILSQKVKLNFIPENVADDAEDEQSLMLTQAGELISSYSETLWEKLKMDSHMREALLDAAISGDMDGYTFWDSTIVTGQTIEGVPIEGDLNFEMADNVNIHFGNPNSSRIDTRVQPWMMISFRELVKKLREEAKLHGVKEQDLLNITSDNDYQEQSGEMAKIEIDSKDEDGKTTALIKFWLDSKTKTIHYTKSVKNQVIVPDTDMEITRYPIAHANWDRRKNSCHGQAVGTGLIPNQIFINKMFAMVMLNLMNVAFPKAIYNMNLIPNWSNQVGQAIGVQSADDITRVATYLQPGNMSNQVMQVIDAAINYTKDLIGVTDAALGDIKPDNTSTIIAVQQASAVPLENIKANLYQWVEDIGYIWIDMMVAKYGIRNLTVMEKGKRKVIPFDFSKLKDVKFMLKVEVGASSYWSEIASIQSLDRLLMDSKIDFIQYLERIPDGVIPKKEDLLNEIRAAMAQPKNPNPAPPSSSLTYEDLPMAGKIQLAAQHNIQLEAQDFIQQAQFDAKVEADKKMAEMGIQPQTQVQQQQQLPQELMQQSSLG